MPSRLSIGEFLESHPWPQDRVADARPLDFLWHFDLDVPATDLWPHLIDTSRLNRALGLSEMHFEERDGVRHGSSVSGGKRHEWVEVPWSWAAPHTIEAVRIYSRGFATYVRAIYQLVPTGDRSHTVRVYIGWVPRGPISRWLLSVGTRPMEKKYRRVLSELAADAQKPQPAPYKPPPPELTAEGQRRLREVTEQLASEGLPAGALDGIVGFVRERDDIDAHRIQPRRLAHELGLDEADMVRTCLHATRAGLLQLSWDVICPHCRGVREEFDNLDQLSASASCQVCDIEFGTDADNAVEITFRVHPSVRDVPKVFYCSAEPSTKLHIKLQKRLEPGDSRDVTLPLEPGRYRMRVVGGSDRTYLTVARGGSSEPIEWRASDEPREIQASSPLSVAICNDSDEARLFVVEEVDWGDEALRPGVLFSNQEFRDLFAREYLEAGVQLSIGEQTLMFTDMVGSTRFYAEYGDPRAFVRVRDHFKVMRRVVHDHNGAVVKTIGDAVMATFSSPVDAVAAARKIHSEFPPVQEVAPPVRVRVSLNTGPCIAVNLNTGVDFFGGTVNVAAKLQACAEAGEIALAKSVYDAPGVADYLRDNDVAADKRVYEFPGLDPLTYFFVAEPT